MSKKSGKWVQFNVSTSSSEETVDILSHRPSHSPTTSTASSGSGDTTSPSNETSARHGARKQINPKKREDRMIQQILRLQQTTNLLIQKLPFQRYVSQKKTIVICLLNINQSQMSFIFHVVFILFYFFSLCAVSHEKFYKKDQLKCVCNQWHWNVYMNQPRTI